jgi:hypothetical protein
MVQIKYLFHQFFSYLDMNFKENPRLDLRLLFWTCKENCSYLCMWETVNFFSSRGLYIPQFHGKVNKVLSGKD